MLAAHTHAASMGSHSHSDISCHKQPTNEKNDHCQGVHYGELIHSINFETISRGH